MMGVPAPFVAPGAVGLPSEAPAQRQQVVVSARRGFEAEPEPVADVAAARKRAHKQTIIGGIQAPMLGSTPPAAALSAPTEKHWTVALTDTDHRDMTTSELVALFALGKVTPETLVWRDGMPQWARPFDVAELAEALRARGYEHAPKAATPRDDEDDDEVTRMVASPLDSPPSASASAGAAWREPGRDEDDDEVTRAIDADVLLGSTAAKQQIAEADDDEITRAVDSPLAVSPRISDFPAPPDPDHALRQAVNPGPLPWPEPPKSIEHRHDVVPMPPPPAPVSRPVTARSAPSHPLPVRVPIPSESDEVQDEDDEYESSGNWLRWLIAAIVVLLMLVGGVFGVFYTEQPAPAYQRLRSVMPAAVQSVFERTAVAFGKHPRKQPVVPSPTVPPPRSSASPADKRPGPAFNLIAATRAMADAASNAQTCQRPGGPTGLGHVLVTFDRSGHATKVQVLDTYTNTDSGRCIEQLFLKTEVPPFAEPPVTVQKTFTVQ